MARRPLLAAVLAVAVLAAAPAHADNLDHLHASTLRLTAPNGDRGTGTVFIARGTDLWILTCAHVATARRLEAEFYFEGHQSRPIPARLLWRDEPTDLAVVHVDASPLAGHLPAVTRLAPPDRRVERGDRLRTAGSAKGAWPTGWVGHALGYADGDLHFIPPPASGRSGSAVIDDSGRIVGVVRARSQNGDRGIATAVQHVYRLWGSEEQRTRAAAVEMPTVPATPGVPTQRGAFGLCDPRQPQQGPQRGADPFPTLPPRASPGAGPGGAAFGLDPSALAPLIDHATGPLRESLDRIEKRMEAFAESQQREAAEQRGRELLDSAPDDLGDALRRLTEGDLRGAAYAATGETGWTWVWSLLGQVVAGATGIGGVGAIGLRFGWPLVGRFLHRRIISPRRNEMNDLLDDIAEAVAAKENGKPKK